MTTTTEMRKFKGHKTYEQIKQQCDEQDLNIIDSRYLLEGGDHIGVWGGGARITYSVVNGRFWGVTPNGTEFNSDNTDCENEPWFQALLRFFLIE